VPELFGCLREVLFCSADEDYFLVDGKEVFGDGASDASPPPPPVMMAQLNERVLGAILFEFDE
jgi:hypothetical protein